MKKEYHIIGVGTIGFPLAKRLFESKEVTIHLWDDDTIGKNDIVFPKYYAGRSKVEVAKDLIKRKFNSIIIHNQKCTNKILDTFSNKIVIDCTDTKSEFKLKCNVSISYDGPILTISDGRLVNISKDIPFYYPKKLAVINRAAEIAYKNIQSAFSYVNYKIKVYKIAQNNEEESELIYSSKRLSTIQKGYLNNKPLLIDKVSITKKVKQLERQKQISNIFYEVQYMNSRKKQIDVLTLPKCSNTAIINALGNINTVCADSYYLRACNSYIKNNEGFLQLEFYYLPTTA